MTGYVDARPLSISFVVPVLDDADRLSRCLESIGVNGRAGVEVIVVDNGSTDGSDRVATAAGATLIVKRDGSVGTLRNVGALAAHGDVIAFVDADHEISRRWVATIREVFVDLSTAAAGAPYSSGGATWVQRTYDGLRDRPSVRRQVAWLGSGNLAVRRSVFLKIGGFDESLQTCEDVDLCRRLRAGNRVIVSDPDLASVHHGDPEHLRAVVGGEAWRGRDNLRVSLRRPLDRRAVASAATPLAALAGSAAAIAAVATGRNELASVCLGGPTLLVTARALRICANRHTWTPLAILQGLAVAASYEAGRAIGLVARVGHRVRRPRGADAGTAG